ncbi:hypothetical protein A8C56_12355 [Niabella ginsenosidivorans]|uniref:Uncharacterized protein n=1 Tax=Niabella ginsenosidivorans TaxID=1176587 RepID=A0A1A9I1Z1_9BACT|nr:hypothetical protein [Niabella ginsenosidivorans]ANH81668.1 hypothetical protein A8C56_12355 [Niabella ginsenosidivorans]
MMYLHFFHGRKTIDEEMNDWGEDGPIIETDFVSWTYGSLKLHDKDGDFIFVRETNGLIPIGNMYYGDFEILPDTDEIAGHKPVLSLKAFEQLNCKQ